ncbi:hypothetical protein HDV05_008193, partial [Chytridiales sp. JEL 0842]
DFDEVYLGNKHNLLFRYVLKVKDALETTVSMQLLFSVPGVWVRVQLLDGDVEIASGRGRGGVVVHAVGLVGGPEDVTAPASGTAPVVSTPSGKKDEKKEKVEDKKEKVEPVKDAAVLPTLPVSKHKYILQATIEPAELMKALAGLGDSGRSTSRGGKSQTSARRKKLGSAGVGGAAGTPTTGSAGGNPTSAPSTAGSSAGTEKGGSAGGVGEASVSTPSGPTANTTTAALSKDRPNDVAVLEPAWKLRVICTDNATLSIAKDTEKEDRYKLLKDSWEAAQPGRAAKAKEAREVFLKGVDSGSIRPVYCIPPAAECNVAGAKRAKSAGGIPKGTELVYKPWTIVKDTGAGGRQLSTFGGMERYMTILGPDGERVMMESAGGPGTASMLSLTGSTAGAVEGPPPMSAGSLSVSVDLGKRVSKSGAASEYTSGNYFNTGHKQSIAVGMETPTHTRPSLYELVKRSTTAELKERPSVSSALNPLGNIAEYTNLSEDRIDYIPALPQTPLTTLYVIPKIRAKVLTAEERTAKAQMRDEKIVEFEKEYELLKQRRAEDKALRMRTKQLQAEKLEELYRDVEKEREEDTQRRDSYRQRVIREMEEAAARRMALEAQRAAELAALEGAVAEEQAAAAAANAEKGKKKGGKK